MVTFKDFGLDAKVLNAIEKLGYDKPTEIQAHTIEPAINGSDILGIAQTGSGKTAAFLIPMIKKLAEGRAKARMPRGLVITPTRELAAQIYENFSNLAADIKLTSTLIIGGTSYQEQQKALNTGVDIIIGTPGRIYDHLERQNVMLHGIQYLVIDEADRMLDEGFIPQIEMICSRTSPRRQTLFYSATMYPEIEKLADEFLTDPLRIEVSPRASVSEDIEQLVFIVDKGGSRDLFKQKRNILRKVINHFGDDLSNAIIFSNTKNHVDILQKSMKFHGFESESIHGDHTQSVRTEALNKFRNGEIQFLIASDVASRGLDIPLVSHVINLDVPVNPEDYIHRIGRTGRAGNKGTSVTLCSKKELNTLDSIEKLISKPLNKFKLLLKGKSQELRIVPLNRVDENNEENSKGMMDMETEDTDISTAEKNKSESQGRKKKKGKHTKRRESPKPVDLESASSANAGDDNMTSGEAVSDTEEAETVKPVRRRWSYRKKDLYTRKSKNDAAPDNADDKINVDLVSGESPEPDGIQASEQKNKSPSKQKEAGKSGQRGSKRGNKQSMNKGFEGRTPAFVYYDFD